MKILLKTSLVLYLALCPSTQTLSKQSTENHSCVLLTVKTFSELQKLNVLVGLRHVSTPATKKYLKDYLVFSVRQARDLSHPTGHYGVLLVEDDKPPTYLRDLSDAAAFLSKTVGDIKTQEKANEILRMIPEIFSYEIVTSHPDLLTLQNARKGLKKKELSEEKSKILQDLVRKLEEKRDAGKYKQSDWDLVFSKDKHGWSMTCSLLYDAKTSLYYRVTITTTPAGEVKVSEPKLIYRANSYI